MLRLIFSHAVWGFISKKQDGRWALRLVGKNNGDSLFHSEEKENQGSTYQTSNALSSSHGVHQLEGFEFSLPSFLS